MKTGFWNPGFGDSGFTALVGSRVSRLGFAVRLPTKAVEPESPKLGFLNPVFMRWRLRLLEAGLGPVGKPRGSTPDQGGKGRAFWTPSSWGGILDSSRRGATLFLRFPKIMLRYAMVFKIKLISGYFKVILGHFGIEARKSECEILLSFSFVNQRKSLVNIVFYGLFAIFFRFFLKISGFCLRPKNRVPAYEKSKIYMKIV